MLSRTALFITNPATYAGSAGSAGALVTMVARDVVVLTSVLSVPVLKLVTALLA